MVFVNPDDDWKTAPKTHAKLKIPPFCECHDALHNIPLYNKCEKKNAIADHIMYVLKLSLLFLQQSAHSRFRGLFSYIQLF